MTKAAKCFLVLVVLLFPKLIFAGDSSVQVKIENSVNSHSSTTVQKNSITDIDISTSGNEETNVEINNDDFKISGTISSSGSGSFDVSNQKIYNEPSRFSDYSLSGAIETGKKVTVEGKVIDGKLYARKINSDRSSSSAPTPQPSAQTSSSASPSPSISPSVTASTSASVNPSPSPSTSPSPQEIIEDLNKVIGMLEGIVKVLVILF